MGRGRIFTYMNAGFLWFSCIIGTYIYKNIVFYGILIPRKMVLIYIYTRDFLAQNLAPQEQQQDDDDHDDLLCPLMARGVWEAHQGWRGGTRMSCWHLVTILSKLGCFTYLGDLQPTYIGVIIYLLSSMDILVYTYDGSMGRGRIFTY